MGGRGFRREEEEEERRMGDRETGVRRQAYMNIETEKYIYIYRQRSIERDKEREIDGRRGEMGRPLRERGGEGASKASFKMEKKTVSG